jgi:hypothetical protein
MENEKESEEIDTSACCGRNGRFHQYHFRPIRMCLMICGMVIIFGGIFALGRISASHIGVGKIGIVRNVQIESNGIMTRGNSGQSGRGGAMIGRRGGHEQQLGEITAINGNILTVKISNADCSVSVTDATSYSKAGNIAKQSDLKVGDTILIIGSSNSQGQIAATAIAIQ